MNKNEIYTAFFIAKKNIIKNRKSLLLTVLIISLGFISSIIIYGVLRDTSHDIQENFIETTLGHITLEPYSNVDKIENVDNTIKKIRTLPNVVGVASVIKSSARLFDKDMNFVDTELFIVNPRDFQEVSVIPSMIKEGSWLNIGEKNRIVVGCMNIERCNEIKAFDRIDINVGERFLISPQGSEPIELILQGIYDHRFIQVEITSYINQETAREIFKEYDSTKADKIIILLTSRQHTDKIVEELSMMNLRLNIADWKEKSTKYSSIVDSFLVIGDLSFLIGVIISAISIYVVLYINILNKKTQIGIIKALGIKSKVVALSYFILSFFLGIVGSIFGIILTLLMVEYFKFNPIQTGIGDLVPQVSIQIFAVVSIAIISASLASGYLVSKRITKKNIIDSIFHG